MPFVDIHSDAFDGTIPTKPLALAKGPGAEDLDDGTGRIGDGCQAELEPPGRCGETDELALGELLVVLDREGVVVRLLGFEGGYMPVGVLDRLIE